MQRESECECLKHSIQYLGHVISAEGIAMDSSAKVVGVVLIQDGNHVAYGSKKPNHAQQNYSSYECKLFAIIYALRKE